MPFDASTSRSLPTWRAVVTVSGRNRLVEFPDNVRSNAEVEAARAARRRLPDGWGTGPVHVRDALILQRRSEAVGEIGGEADDKMRRTYVPLSVLAARLLVVLEEVAAKGGMLPSTVDLLVPCDVTRVERITDAFESLHEMGLIVQASGNRWRAVRLVESGVVLRSRLCLPDLVP